MEFLHPITISPLDIDQLGHVNNTVYLRWVQDAAIAHWNSLATDEMRRNHIWIIARHEIDYLRSCLLDSHLVAKTWVGESEGVKSIRYVDIIDTHSQKTMAKIKTTWILLDAQSRRPKRVSSEIMSVFK